MKKGTEKNTSPSACKSEIPYNIVICNGKNFLIPDNCVECGKTLEEKGAVSSSGKFKICSTCRNKQRTLFRKTVKVFFTSVIIGIFAFFTTVFLYRTNYTSSVIISAVFAAASFTVFSLLLNVPSDLKSTFPGKAVKIQHGKKGKSTTIILKNDTFAEKFKKINSQTIRHSDIFENSHIRKRIGNTHSMAFYIPHFAIKALSTSLSCILILTCCYPFVSTLQKEFYTYINNTCIYPGCSLNRGKNLYYCEIHKCLIESCERPIYSEDGYCHVHGS